MYADRITQKFSVMRFRPEKYNTRTGIWEREVKTLDTFSIGSAYNAMNASTILSSTVLPSTENALLIGLSCGSDQVSSVSVVGSTSGTLFTVTNSADENAMVVSSNDDYPLSFLAAGETVSLVAESLSGATSTFSAYAHFKLEPVQANLETE